ncbi:hypothetical protein EDD15DRAFT_2195742 [Pisolithus albus]|nr:hypothetical protein EDD15DRAFT_2195742 [Pisolithus albus]
MRERTSRTPTSSWTTHRSQMRNALGSLFTEGANRKSEHPFLDEVYMGVENPSTHDSKSHLAFQSIETQEASLVLKIIRAQREVHRAEKLLAECLVQEHEKIANLHRFKAKQGQDSIDNSDLSIGWIKAVFNNHGQIQPSAPLCTSIPSSPQPTPDMDVLELSGHPRMLYSNVCLLMEDDLDAWKWLHKLITQLGKHGMSSEESSIENEIEEVLRVKNMEWRRCINRELELVDFQRLVDVDVFAPQGSHPL